MNDVTDAAGHRDGDGPAGWRPLDGMLVLDFSQFLAGPVAALRLGDLGARVIKVERPLTGELGRRLAFAGLEVDGDSLSFHAMNRGKESFTADLKQPSDLDEVRRLAARADVIVQNFRPGVMARLGLDYESVRAVNPRIVYGSISGYGDSGPWKDKPGQDLLAQAVSGLPWLNGASDDGPVPVGVSVADLLASIHLAHGITALLLRRERTGQGGLVETSLLEGMLDLQFELLTAYLYDSGLKVRRGETGGAHPFIAAPYGVYPTSDGYLAIAMSPLSKIGALIGLDKLAEYDADPALAWDRKDEIIALLREHLVKRSTSQWLDTLEPADIWCAQVYQLPELVSHDGFRELRMAQETVRPPAAPDTDPVVVRTPRSPLRIDGRLLGGAGGSPRLGADTAAIRDELLGGSGGAACGEGGDAFDVMDDRR
jgi:CoA:oxalate CoA-transferase